MYQKVEKLFYILASFVIFTAFFVIAPTDVPETQAFQSGMRLQFNKALAQTLGDGPVFQDIALIWNGVTDFYISSADATIALLDSKDADRDIIYVASEVYATFSAVFEPNDEAVIAQTEPELSLPDNFMQEPGIYSIAPPFDGEDYLAEGEPLNKNSGLVAGESYVLLKPVNTKEVPWVSLRDNITGEVYCTAIYDGEVNKYDGACKYDSPNNSFYFDD